MNLVVSERLASMLIKGLEEDLEYAIKELKEQEGEITALKKAIELIEREKKELQDKYELATEMNKAKVGRPKKD